MEQRPERPRAATVTKQELQQQPGSMTSWWRTYSDDMMTYLLLIRLFKILNLNNLKPETSERKRTKQSQ